MVHDLDSKRLLFATTGRDHTSVERFAKVLTAHDGKPEQIEHVCMDMSAACAQGAQARLHGDATTAAADLRRWIGWARRSRLESFKRLGATLSGHFQAVVRGMFEHRSNAFVEAMNGLLQQAKRAVRGFRSAATFISIAYLRMGKLMHLPTSPFVPAMPRDARRMVGRV